MTNGSFKKRGLIFIISLLLASMLCFGAFAEPSSEGEEVSESVVETEQSPVTEPQSQEQPSESTAPPTTEEASSAAYIPETTSKRHNTATSTTEKRNPHNNNRPTPDNGNDDDDDNNYVWNEDDVNGDNGENGEEEEKGFTVYIELNNGEERKRYDLEKEGKVPEPTEKPVRKGFKFAGWFADPEFKTVWNFEKDIAKEGTVIYVKWEADKATVLHKITVTPAVGGTIEVNPSEAAAGENINITVTPDKGKRLKEGSVFINGAQSDLLSFEMISADVTVSAEFEDIPKTEENKRDSGLVMIIIGVAVIAAIAAAVIAVAIKRKNAALDEDEDDDMWVDNSITVEDGFKDGKVVKELDESELFPPENIGEEE